MLSHAEAGNHKIIPVVVHIIHDNGIENISNAQVESQIEVLNEDFGKLPGTNGDGSGVDTEIRFRLAKIDPKGNCTNGILRIKTYLLGFQNLRTDQVLEQFSWDPAHYFNIFVIPNSGFFGYSAFPDGPKGKDFALVRHDHFGRVGTASNTLGRVGTHEAGHWLGLFHTFRAGCGSDPCTTGDMVCDTPPVALSNGGCAISNSCSNDFPDLFDQVENYMDYTSDSCKSIFTAGQRDRMQGVLLNIRTDLWSSANLLATGVDSSYISPPNCPVVANLFASGNQFCIGETVDFSDHSQNDPNAWHWSFPGGTPSSSTLQDPTVTYATPGTYDVTLIASKNGVADTVVYSNYITALAPMNGTGLSWIQSFKSNLYPPTGIDIVNYDKGITWEITSDASWSNQYSIRIDNFSNTNHGSADELVLPFFDFTSGEPDSILRMTFRYASARTPISFSDQLHVMLTTDCGQSWINVLTLTDSALSTSFPVFVPFVPNATQWKEAYVFLDNRKMEPYIGLKIVNVPMGGNFLYLDNIYVGDGSVPLYAGISETLGNKPSMQVFPNPSNGSVTVSFKNASNTSSSVRLFNQVGQLVYEQHFGSMSVGLKSIHLNLPSLPSGTYHLILQNGNGSQVAPIVIEEN